MDANRKIAGKGGKAKVKAKGKAKNKAKRDNLKGAESDNDSDDGEDGEVTPRGGKTPNPKRKVKQHVLDLVVFELHLIVYLLHLIYLPHLEHFLQ
jgi:hypothetical protein